MNHRLLPLLLLLALPASVQAKSDYPNDPLSSLLERTADRLEERLRESGVTAAVQFEMQTEGGLSLPSTRRFFFTPLVKKLKRRGTVRMSRSSSTQIRLKVSVDPHRVWVIGTLEAPSLVGPSPFVVSQVLSNELRLAIGSRRPDRASLQWRVHPIGTVQGRLLDLCITHVAPDRSTIDIAILDTSGVQIFRHDTLQNTLNHFIGHAFLRNVQPWPRVITGWMGLTTASSLIATTSRGDSLEVDLARQRTQIPRTLRVPLRIGTPGTAWGRHQSGSPNIAGPLKTPAGGAPPPRTMSAAFRDARPLGERPQWYWVTPQGMLQTSTSTTPVQNVLQERIGDRILFADLDGDGEKELIHTRAALPGQSDALLIRTVPSPTTPSALRFKAPLGGGSIVAMDVLPSTGGDRESVIVAEQISGTEHRLWRLEAL